MRIPVPALACCPGMALLAALCGCGGVQPVPAASMRPAERPECQLSSANEPPPPGQLSSLDYHRCHPGERLEWSRGREGAIKPDFGGSRDE